MPRLLAFHAHPDDESISMGGTLAGYAGAGAKVTVVTATLGEEGEIHNRDDAEQIRDRLGEVRTAEARAACAILGVDDLAFLGYRDSGMMGTAGNGHPDAFWQADFMEAVGRLVTLIRSRRPDVVTAYDPFGGYGHPDHIQVHRVGTAAYFGAADVGRFPAARWGEPHLPKKLYWATWSRERTRRALAASGGEGEQPSEPEEPDSGTLDEHITTRRDVAPWVERKIDAVLAHDTQFAADSWLRTMPRDRLAAALGEEVFVRAHSSVPSDPGDPDLFAGVA